MEEKQMMPNKADQSHSANVDQFFSDFEISKVTREVSIQSFLATAAKLRNEIRLEAALSSSYKPHDQEEEDINPFKVDDANTVFNSEMTIPSPAFLNTSWYNEDPDDCANQNSSVVVKKKVFTIHKDQRISINITKSRRTTAEEDSGVIEDCLSDWSSTDENTKPRHKKSKVRQNPKKNLPGLVLQRINKSCFEYINQDSKKMKVRKLRQIEYIGQILREYSQEVLQGLSEFTRSYDRNSKTWTAVERFLLSNKEYGAILLRVIEAFLSRAGIMDFSDWVESGKMKDRGKREAIESKGWLLRNFNDLMTKFEN